MQSSGKELRQVDAVVVGAGFAGLYMLHRLRGMGLSVQVFETGSSVGGTWFWNRYPGARCDVESMQYSYQFSEELQQEWEWTERYASQPEILKYIEHVADRFDLRKDIQLNTRVERMIFDETSRRWLIETNRGDKISARYCMMATGCLSAQSIPNFKNRESFKGKSYHTADWPKDGAEIKNRRVGVIGTGSTGLQVIPLIAEEAKHLFVFQRTATYSIPARNMPLDPKQVSMLKANYRAFREKNNASPAGISINENKKSAMEIPPEELQRELEKRWSIGGVDFVGACNDIMTNEKSNQVIADFCRNKIRKIVLNPEVAEALTPKQIFGCKRLCLDTGYFQTFNRPNVTLVSLDRYPIDEINERGVLVNGKTYELDTIVYATGFDAVTGPLLKIDIRGRNGKSLKDKWADGPKTFLGLNTEGFPNFFTINGPGSPSVIGNMVVAIEQHVNWISKCVDHMETNGIGLIEATKQAEDDWTSHVNEVASKTLYSASACKSWYLGSNIPGKPRVFLAYAGGYGVYAERCSEVIANGFKGFRLGRD